MEIRHFFVHEDGKATEDFRKENTAIKYDKEGNIQLNFNTITKVRAAVIELIDEIEMKSVEKGYFK